MITWLVGVGQNMPELAPVQLVSRTILVYGAALLLLRIGKRRFMGRFTAFDILMGFVVGSVISRAIIGQTTLLGAAIILITLMIVHYAISLLSYYNSSASRTFKESKRALVIKGKIDEEAMQQSKLGEGDLLQAIRKEAGVEAPEEIQSAYLERDGSITIIPKEREPKIVEVTVEEGVQKVMISFS